jgi:hypothetical protein
MDSGLKQLDSNSSEDERGLEEEEGECGVRGGEVKREEVTVLVVDCGKEGGIKDWMKKKRA